jgi:anti-sigma regulatory factor (Ser/Thr protein kinase)
MAHLTDTVELLVSEIVTNAVRASAGQAHSQAISIPTVRFWLTSDGYRILIQVWDCDRDTPAPQAVELDAESGRGLLLVETLSTQLGQLRPRQPVRQDRLGHVHDRRSRFIVTANPHLTRPELRR